MKKFTLAAVFMLAALMTACSSDSSTGNETEQQTEETSESSEQEESSAEDEAEDESSEESTETGDDRAIGMSNPFVDCDSQEEAEEVAGFEFDTPVFDDMENRSYQAIEGELAQVFYRGGGAPDDGYILVRKAPVALQDEPADGEPYDIIGDFTDYEVVDEFDIDGVTVIARGHDEDQYQSIIWTDGDYCYGIQTSGVWLTKELLESYIPKIK